MTREDAEILIDSIMKVVEFDYNRHHASATLYEESYQDHRARTIALLMRLNDDDKES